MTYPTPSELAQHIKFLEHVDQLMFSNPPKRREFDELQDEYEQEPKEDKPFSDEPPYVE